jgi:hypothetical protein
MKPCKISKSKSITHPKEKRKEQPERERERTNIQQGVCHTMALPFTLKSILIRQKEDLWKFKYFTMQKYNLQKNPFKETKILKNIITL